MLQLTGQKRNLLTALPLLCALVAPLYAVGCGEEEAPEDSPQRDASSRNDASKDGGGPQKPDRSAPQEASVGDDVDIEALAGRYMIRFDTLGTARSKGFPKLTIRSRVSTLVLAELTADGGKLVGKEKVCAQVIEQKCLDNTCTSAVSEVDPRATALMGEDTYERTYTVAEGALTGGSATYTLGYDGDADAPLPTSNTDEAVWDIEPGNPREGLLTKATVSVKPLPDVTCSFFGVQKFVSTFSGFLGGTESAPEVPEAMTLDVGPSGGNRIGATTEPCDMQQVDSPLDEANARMVRYGADLSEDAFWDCPSESAFDDEIPPTAL